MVSMFIVPGLSTFPHYFALYPFIHFLVFVVYPYIPCNLIFTFYHGTRAGVLKTLTWLTFPFPYKSLLTYRAEIPFLILSCCHYSCWRFCHNVTKDPVASLPHRRCSIKNLTVINPIQHRLLSNTDPYLNLPGCRHRQLLLQPILISTWVAAIINPSSDRPRSCPNLLPLSAPTLIDLDQALLRSIPICIGPTSRTHQPICPYQVLHLGPINPM